MVLFIVIVYSVGVVLALIGIFRFRSYIKKNAPQSIDAKVENTGSPMSGGIDYIKIICK